MCWAPLLSPALVSSRPASIAQLPAFKHSAACLRTWRSTHPQRSRGVLVPPCSTLPQCLGCLHALDQVGVLCKGAALELPRAVQAQEVDCSAAGGPAKEDDRHNGDDGPAARMFLSGQSATVRICFTHHASVACKIVLLPTAIPD